MKTKPNRFSFSSLLAIPAALAVAALSMALAPSASATAYVSTATGGNWNAPTTWTANSGFPGQNDTAEIVNGATVTANAHNNYCGGLTIDAGGTNIVANTQKLKLKIKTTLLFCVCRFAF